MAKDSPTHITMNIKTDYKRCELHGITKTESKEDKKKDNELKVKIRIAKRMYKNKRPDCHWSSWES